ncbi:hypothetical protein CCP3SC15_230029 [Gammaproteobacteria bacterium]
MADYFHVTCNLFKHFCGEVDFTLLEQAIYNFEYDTALQQLQFLITGLGIFPDRESR